MLVVSLLKPLIRNLLAVCLYDFVIFHVEFIKLAEGILWDLICVRIDLLEHSDLSLPLYHTLTRAFTLGLLVVSSDVYFYFIKND